MASLSSYEIQKIIKDAKQLKKRLESLPKAPHTFINPNLPKGAPLTTYIPYYPDETTLVDLRGKN